MKKLFWAICLCMLLILAGCGAQRPETEPVCYTVRFVMKGNVCSEQTVVEGYLPQPVTPRVEGLRFVQWLDEQGEPVNPFTTFVDRDTRYEARAYPELTQHVPYLFADEAGYLRPDAVLTADELLQALQALAAEGAERYFPGMPVGSQAMTADVLRQVLESFYAPDAVAEAFPQEAAAELTRTAFAQGMHKLLGRRNSETLSMDQDVPLPYDLTRDRTDTTALLEACMRHTPGTGEHNWSQLILPEEQTGGFVNEDGFLYYLQSDNTYLTDGYVGKLYFDQQGRYTSGDAKLDQLVAEILRELIAQQPDADRQTLLRAVYDYCHENFQYLGGGTYSFGQTGWELQDAAAMLETGSGNAYRFAAGFWALSRGLGYETRAVSGTCTNIHQPHGWCMIAIDGQDYFFDLAWEYAYREEGTPVQDMFMIPMDETSHWNYRWQE